MELTSAVTTAAMGIGAVTISNSIPEVETAETLLLSVAFGSYIGLNATKNEGFRYLDWIITTPLLVFTYWKSAEVRGWRGSFRTLGLSAIFMSALGYFADKGPWKNYLVGLSFLFLSLILLEVYRISSYLQTLNNPALNILPIFFYLGWTLYGLTFYLPFETRSTIWNVLDLINKPVYALVLSEANKGF
jgi:bacteriorhodopsin